MMRFFLSKCMSNPIVSWIHDKHFKGLPNSCEPPDSELIQPRLDLGIIDKWKIYYLVKIKKWRRGSVKQPTDYADLRIPRDLLNQFNITPAGIVDQESNKSSNQGDQLSEMKTIISDVTKCVLEKNSVMIENADYKVQFMNIVNSPNLSIRKKNHRLKVLNNLYGIPHVEYHSEDED